MKNIKDIDHDIKIQEEKKAPNDNINVWKCDNCKAMDPFLAKHVTYCKECSQHHNI